MVVVEIRYLDRFCPNVLPTFSFKWRKVGLITLIPGGETLPHVPEPLHESGLLPLDPVLRAPASRHRFRVVVVEAVVDSGVLRQVSLAPQAANVIQTWRHKHVCYGAPVITFLNVIFVVLRLHTSPTELKTRLKTEFY